ncbi:MAG: endonuclease III [Alphaproteobacteria bacterium]|nr:MAG: endonuclease III [Alphaproteobacteria bacterium]
MSSAEIEQFFSILQAANPEPKTELEYKNPFTLLVAVVLSAQATDASVNKATKDLFKKIDSPQKMLVLGEAGLKNYVKTIGLYNAKAKNIIALSKILIDEFGGEVPRTREELEKLPGVGRKTANVVLNVVFGQATLAVDTHIFRVSNRTGLAPGKNPLEVELNLEKRVPEKFKRHAHHWIILHGRYICKARRPECFRCPVVKQCQYPDRILEN